MKNFAEGRPRNSDPLRSFVYRLLVEATMDPLYQRIATEVPISKGRVLDIRCGRGRLDWAINASRPGLRIIGMDESNQRLAEARRGSPSTSVDFRLGLVETAKYSNEYDFAFSFFYFRRWEQPLTGLEAVYRALKPGGQFWVYVPDREATDEDLRSDYALFNGLPPATALLRWVFANRGFSLAEAQNAVRPAVAKTSFREMAVVRTGATLRFEFVRKSAAAEAPRTASSGARPIGGGAA